MRRYNGGFAAGMRHWHTRPLCAIPAHVFATLFLVSSKLCNRNGACHNRPSEQEDNEQQSKIDNKLHRRRAITTYGQTY